MCAVHPPPAAISWLVTLVCWLGSAGVSVLLVVVGLPVDRGPAGSGGRPADLDRMHPARRVAQAGGRVPPGQRTCRGGRRLSGHPDRGRGRRGCHRPALSEPPGGTVKSLLFLVAIPFAAGSFHAPSGSGGNQAAVWIILAIILAAGVAATLIALVPRLRRLAGRRPPS